MKFRTGDVSPKNVAERKPKDDFRSVASKTESFSRCELHFRITSRCVFLHQFNDGFQTLEKQEQNQFRCERKLC